MPNQLTIWLCSLAVLTACTTTTAGTAHNDPAAGDPPEDFVPSADDPDPSTRIKGVEIVDDGELGRGHVEFTQRVAYGHSPPLGGPHDPVWAACDGAVYTGPIRSETMVHSLEHGAAWIAYNPELVDAEGVDLLSARVAGKQYTVMTPYPGLDKAVSVQTWAHQLKVDTADDIRIDQFIAALRVNPNTTPEVDATCAAIPDLDQSALPPFDPSPPGDDAVPLDFNG